MIERRLLICCDPGTSDFCIKCIECNKRTNVILWLLNHFSDLSNRYRFPERTEWFPSVSIKKIKRKHLTCSLMFDLLNFAKRAKNLKKFKD